MAIGSLISRFFSSTDKSECFDVICDDGLDFSADKKVLNAITIGNAGEYITAQYVCLKMLEEQGLVTAFPDGFMMPSDTAVRLSAEERELLKLAEVWTGGIEVDVTGRSSHPDFAVSFSVSNFRGQMTKSYQISGPYIQFSEQSKYLLSPQQLIAFQALASHHSSAKSEYDNLLLIHALQQAQEQGGRINLQHFDKLRIITPDQIAVEAEVDASGNLILTPNLGQKASHNKMQRVLGQLTHDSATTLRIGDEIVLFNEEKLDAVKQIISNRVIPKHQVKQFLKTPTAFIDASLVDLDLGFSLRVHGATVFKHAYFGETDQSGIDWFAQAANAEVIYPFSKIKDTVSDAETLEQLSQKIDDAIQTGATVIDFMGNTYEIPDKDVAHTVLNEIKHNLDIGHETIANEVDDKDVTENEGQVSEQDGIYVVDIDLNDDDLSQESTVVVKNLDHVLDKHELDWSNHKRTPFLHQEIGVRWILGLEDKARSEDTISGAILADDMGLGKTFMALSAIEHSYQRCESMDVTQKPVLIVAPLSLLENWQDEVDKTFHTSPFNDVVILQSDADLSTFRLGGTEIRGSSGNDDELELRYSLKVGKAFLNERLDLPKRLVITTYQTLRDYQFSLCLIDWGMVVFDEAQNIKNPNSLQSRAAKGLKADFKLVATGTPVENSLADFWCLMDTVCPGYLGSYQEFRATYISPLLKAAGDEVEAIRHQLGRALREKVGALMLRRVKEDNLEGLPEKHLHAGGHFDGWNYLDSLHSVMQGYQCNVYEGSILSQLQNEDSHALTTLARLRDSSLHPRLADGGRLDVGKSFKETLAIYQESGKLMSLLTTLEQIKAKQQKVIIFAVNKRLQSFLSVSLGQLFGLGPLSVINGDAKAVSKNRLSPTRKTMIEAFEAKDGFNIIVMSPVAAGVGLTVVGANHVIHLERHWNPAKEAQATDRVYRIGQKEDVHIYVPLLYHPEYESFDVNLHRLLTKKTQLKDAVITPEDVIPQPAGMGNGVFGDTLSTRITAENVDHLSWQQFEALCVEIFAKQMSSESCYLTKQGSDHGADGIIVGKQGTSILIQSKFTLRRYEGYKAVQEITSAKPIYENALKTTFDRLVFMTNSSTLGKKVMEVAKACDVEVIGRAMLLELLSKTEVTYKDVLTRLDKQRLSL
ncbi:SNF2-related protein [Vibrio spartinae]|uniref:N-formylmethionyl-tRNA deformylase n=1 Tax=Vibrio spartinae TaxID=1918945 RepID=A0ABX6QY09_9VIBR|nr:SNF2-related protein [Vibrio spartinae]QMV14151.1 N-formylmethionyl-tRNA deformylase [Vibrio spartinae]